MVWTDLNENDVEDAQEMPESGILVMQVPELLTIPGAGLALIEEDEPVQMFALADDFAAWFEVEYDLR